MSGDEPEDPAAPDDPGDSGATALLPGFGARRREPVALDPAPDRGVALGRYLVVGEAGTGGMGLVLRAYDPKLRREVALKRLRVLATGPNASDGAARLLREARAMARLSHPNVLAVYDVEVIADHTYVVMEYVEGTTLLEWNMAPTRAWSETLAMFVQAARGLAAAHAVALVHRDFKPNNVLVGADGRARVMDFGIARAAEETDNDAPRETDSAADPDDGDFEETRTAADLVLGTPAYMAPEQHAGKVADARADQYAWCVALWEALWKRRPFTGPVAGMGVAKQSGPPPIPAQPDVPAWLARVIARGLAPTPEERFATMDELLLEIERAQTRARSRWPLAGVAGVALVGLGAFAVRELGRRERTAACEAAGASISEVWNDDARVKLHDAFVATGVSYAEVTAEKMMPWIEQQADAWQDARTQTCLDRDVRGAWDADLADRSLWCLDERRMELDALITELSRADARAVQRAVQAAAGLSRVAPCRESALLLRLPPPPSEHREDVQSVRAELSRASALERAGKYAAGLEATDRALAQAELLDWPPLVAAARHRRGLLLDRLGDYPAAEQALETAYFEAAAAGATEVEAAAADKLVFTVGYRLARHDDGLRWARLADVAIDELDEPDGLRVASHLDKVAIVHAAAGDNAEAVALHERALAMKERTLGPDHPDVATSLNNLAAVRQSTGAWPEAQALHERALAIRERAFGPDHPDVAMSLSNLGIVHDATGDQAEAVALHERALAIRERALGRDHPDVAASLANLGIVVEARGDHERAAALLGRALAIQEKTLGPDHPDVANSLANLGLVRASTGSLAEAIALFERALAIREKALGPDHLDVAASLNNLGFALSSAGDHRGAKPLLERALAIREKALPANHPDVATTLNNLGVALAGLGEREAAKLAFERALAIREEALGKDHPHAAATREHLRALSISRP